ncbi:MAG: hypothetical protein HZA36_01060 [Parcubacteria group bacterium]|nr:hypothetical protein [Parcubacteria group bacterium]
MNQELTETLVKKLQFEKDELEHELGQISTKTEAGYEPKTPDFGSDTEDPESEETDEAEALGASLAVQNVLETRLNHVEAALRKIEQNTYGVCERCKKNTTDRDLEIDPARPHCRDCSE